MLPALDVLVTTQAARGQISTTTEATRRAQQASDFMPSHRIIGRQAKAAYSARAIPPMDIASPSSLDERPRPPSATTSDA
eukprot:scaffold458019_cov35-Prasinocladus_malaysianus.AAC.1